ncbi:hypothetical protein [Streptomyces lunaelactis]|uniref:hypothetical protein n=1 Tax=Streptomyces lunaelactis TaxID=1535768 RepID=UPI0020C77000|nr:hypothetical protein [Streptomyces lunaelactis]
MVRTRLFAALAGALLLTSCSTADADDPHVTDRRTSHWGKGVGAPEASAFMKVKVPEGATEVKGAVQVNPQEDVYLLSFVTDWKNAEQIAADLRSETPLHPKKHDLPPTVELFGHLGLTEPQTLKGLRWAGVCPPCVSDQRRSEVAWIETYVHSQAQGKARVYLKAF